MEKSLLVYNQSSPSLEASKSILLRFHEGRSYTLIVVQSNPLLDTTEKRLFQMTVQLFKYPTRAVVRIGSMGAFAPVSFKQRMLSTRP